MSSAPYGHTRRAYRNSGPIFVVSSRVDKIVDIYMQDKYRLLLSGAATVVLTCELDDLGIDHVPR